MRFEASRTHETHLCGKCILTYVIASSLPPATSAGDALNSVGLNQYEPIFINVAACGADKHHFTNVDISLNTIEEERPASSPTFVKDYLANLDKKAGLPPEVHSRALLPPLISNKLFQGS